MNAAVHSRGFRPLRTALALLGLGVLSAVAEDTNAPARSATNRLEFAAFRIITERNIFNARRSGRSGNANRETRPAARVEAFTLVGILSYEKGPLAFFDGTSSEFKKALKPEETIAGYRVLDIAGNRVNLATGTNRIELSVGMQLRREDEGGWRVTDRRDVAATTPSPAAAAAAASGAESEPSDVLKRMLEQREKEMR
jgi:hypothetical protein